MIETYERKSKNQSKRDLKDFKGVHYKKEKKIIYHEYGAHFKFQDLCEILSKLQYYSENATSCITNSKVSPLNEKNNSMGNKTNIIILENNKKEIESNIKSTIFPHNNEKNTVNSSNSIKNLTERKSLNGVNKSNLNSSNVIKNINKNSDKNIFNEDQLNNEDTIRNVINKKNTQMIKQNMISINKSNTNNQSKMKVNPIIINKKPIENIELIIPKIDTGIKNLPPIVKKDKLEEKAKVLIKNNQLDIDTNDVNKIKKYEAFNKNIAEMYKSNIQQQNNKVKSLKEIKDSIPTLKNSILEDRKTKTEIGKMIFSQNIK